MKTWAQFACCHKSSNLLIFEADVSASYDIYGLGLMVLYFVCFVSFSCAIRSHILQTMSKTQMSHYLFFSPLPSVQAAGSEEGEVTGRGAVAAGKGEL